MVEQEMEKEAQVQEDSLGEELRGDYDDDNISVLSDIIHVEGADVQGKVLAVIHLMQEGLSSSRLTEPTESAEENTSLVVLGVIIKAIQPLFLSIPPISIPSTSTTPKPTFTQAINPAIPKLLPSPYLPGQLQSHRQLKLSVYYFKSPSSSSMATYVCVNSKGFGLTSAS